MSNRTTWTDALVVLLVTIGCLVWLWRLHGWETTLAMALLTGAIGRPWRR